MSSWLFISVPGSGSAHAEGEGQDSQGHLERLHKLCAAQQCPREVGRKSSCVQLCCPTFPRSPAASPTPSLHRLLPAPHLTPYPSRREAMSPLMGWAGMLGRPEDSTGGNWVWLKEGKPGV